MAYVGQLSLKHELISTPVAVFWWPSSPVAIKSLITRWSPLLSAVRTTYQRMTFNSAPWTRCTSPVASVTPRIVTMQHIGSGDMAIIESGVRRAFPRISSCATAIDLRFSPRLRIALWRWTSCDRDWDSLSGARVAILRRRRSRWWGEWISTIAGTRSAMTSCTSKVGGGCCLFFSSDSFDWLFLIEIEIFRGHSIQQIPTVYWLKWAT